MSSMKPCQIRHETKPAQHCWWQKWPMTLTGKKSYLNGSYVCPRCSKQKLDQDTKKDTKVSWSSDKNTYAQSTVYKHCKCQIEEQCIVYTTVIVTYHSEYLCSSYGKKDIEWRSVMCPRQLSFRKTHQTDGMESIIMTSVEDVAKQG